jgi:Uma2 family endonuclease
MAVSPALDNQPHGLLTVGDYMRLDDGRRYELIDGELRDMTPAPAPRHQAILMELTLVVTPWVRERGLGEVYFAPFDVVLGPRTVVQPDLVFISRGRDIVDDRNCKGAPDLVVEILSPSSRPYDLEIKRERYERAGIAHYWIVDPDTGTVEELTLAPGGRYERLQARTATEVLRPAAFPGLEIDLTKIFRA